MLEPVEHDLECSRPNDPARPVAGGRWAGASSATPRTSWRAPRGGVTPHVGQNTSGRSSAIHGRTAGQEGYRVIYEGRRGCQAGGCAGWFDRGPLRPSAEPGPACRHPARGKVPRPRPSGRRWRVW